MLIDNSLILDNAFTLTTTGSSTNYIDTIGAAGGQAQISTVNTIQGGYDAYEADWFEAIVTKSMTGGGVSLDVQLWTANVIANIWTTGNAGSAPTALAGHVGHRKSDQPAPRGRGIHMCRRGRSLCASQPHFDSSSRHD